MQWILSPEQYFCLYNINEIHCNIFVFLSHEYSNKTKGPRHWTAQPFIPGTRFIPTLYLFSKYHNIYSKWAILITLKKSVKKRYGFYGSGLKTGVENDIFWSFLIIGSGLGEPCGTSPPPRIPRSTPRPPLTMDQCQRRPIRGLLLYFNLLQNAQKWFIPLYV